MKILTLTFLLISCIAQAQTTQQQCTSTDHRAELGPLRFQDQTPWCYAYSAADLLSFEMKQVISATDIVFSPASDAVHERTLDETYLGSTSGALKNALTQGLCLESRLPSNSPLSVVRLYQKDPQNFKKNMDHQCGDRIHISGLAVKRNLYNEKNLVLNEILSRGKIAEITIDGNIYLESAKNQTQWNVNHSSLVIGRKWNTQRSECTYLIRNAWGEACYGIRSELDCQRGYLWLPESDLMKSSSEILTLESVQPHL